MKRTLYIVMLQTLVFVFTFCEGNLPANFEFSEPSTWSNRFAPLLYSNTYEEIESNGLHYPPTYFQLDSTNRTDMVISFCYSFSGGASWYTRDFVFDSIQERYEFLVFSIGGRKQFIRFEYNNATEKISMFVREKGIGGDTGWIYFSEVSFLIENYVP